MVPVEVLLGSRSNNNGSVHGTGVSGTRSRRGNFNKLYWYYSSGGGGAGAVAWF